jgi:4-amino-4-deoxy-L-arabinose transferase-like glycosyltransferase
MRLPSIAATVATAWLVVRMARRWWGPVEAAWAAALFLTTVKVVELGGRLQIDPLLTFLCVLALELLTRPEQDPRRRTLLLLAAGGALGLGALAKGPVAYVNVALVVVAWRLFSVGEAPVRVPRWVWWATVAAAVVPVLTWAAVASLAEPRLFEQLFYDQHLGRVTRGDRHPGPVWKHLLQLPYVLLPWTLLVLAELARAARQLRRRPHDLDVASVRAALWFGALVLFYSLIPPKRDMYLLPAYPAAALLGARALVRGIGRGRLTRWITVPPPALLGTVGVVLSLAGLVEDRLPGLLWRGPVLGLPLVVGAVVALASLGRPRRWATATAWSLCLFATAAALVVYPPFNQLKSARSLALELATLPEQPSEIPCIGVQPEGYRFYGGVPAVDAQVLGAHRALEGADFVALVEEGYWDSLPAAERARYRVIQRRPVGGKDVIVLGAAR